MSVNFKKIHNMGSDRISFLEKVSYSITMCGSSATAIAVASHGHTFGVTVAHFNCTGLCPVDVIHCNGLDISLLLGECPPSEFSLDATTFTSPMIGDDAFVYGHSLDQMGIRNYRATIGNLYGRHIGNPPFSGMPNINLNARLLVGASQYPEFSGSAVLNGYGIIGVACASGKESFGTAIVVPWDDIMQCIENNVANISANFPVGCNSTVISSPTLLNRVERGGAKYVTKFTFLKTVGTWIYDNF
jgi:hypothetical protein